MSTVLVTGGSGFRQPLHSPASDRRPSGAHHGAEPEREADARALLREGGADPGDRLSFIAAELNNDAGWSDAVAGCEYVLHVASPFPQTVPKNEDELIVPAPRARYGCYAPLAMQASSAWC